MIARIVASIQDYTRRVERDEVSCNFQRCPKCLQTCEEFRLHERRSRTFFVVDDRFVRKVESVLTRWKCPQCRGSFTVYPDFALPYKRYIRQSVCDLAGGYFCDDEATYKKGVEVEGMAVFYEVAGDEASIDERTLAPSTLHRWISALARFPNKVREALRAIRGKSATSTVFRRLLSIAFPSAKYRSERRRIELHRAVELLETEAEFHVLFGRSLFPDFATAAGWS